MRDRERRSRGELPAPTTTAPQCHYRATFSLGGPARVRLGCRARVLLTEGLEQGVYPGSHRGADGEDGVLGDPVGDLVFGGVRLCKLEVAVREREQRDADGLCRKMRGRARARAGWVSFRLLRRGGGGGATPLRVCRAVVSRASSASRERALHSESARIA